MVLEVGVWYNTAIGSGRRPGLTDDEKITLSKRAASIEVQGRPGFAEWKSHDQEILP